MSNVKEGAGVDEGSGAGVAVAGGDGVTGGVVDAFPQPLITATTNRIRAVTGLLGILRSVTVLLQGLQKD